MEKDDWRLTNQKNYLDNVKLNKREYNLNTHNHCAFCWHEFRKNDIGYTTCDEYHWICEGCFTDFKDEFDWTVTK